MVCTMKRYQIRRLNILLQNNNFTRKMPPNVWPPDEILKTQEEIISSPALTREEFSKRVLKEGVGIVSLRWLIKRGKWPFDVGAHHT